MSVVESELPVPFVEALQYLRAKRDAEARIDAIKDNFAYVWVTNIAKNTRPEQPGGWIRLPLAFPHGNPHGLVTREALKRVGEGNITDGYHQGHDMCAPVEPLGGRHYYSWTWENSPTPRTPEDVVGVVQWYERRVRKG